MSCHDIRRQMVRVLDEPLDAPEGQSLLAHCASCPECDAEFAALRRMMDTCREFVVFPGRAYPFAQLRARMALIHPLEEVRRFLPRLRYYGLAPRYALTLAFLALVVISPGVFRNIRWAMGTAERTVETRVARIERHLEAMESGQFGADFEDADPMRRQQV